MGTPLTVDRCAEMRAEMEAGWLRDEVLARAGLTVDEWTEAQRAWLEKMGAEIDRGRFELTTRYSQAFLDRQRAIAASTPAIAAPAPAEAVPAPAFAAPAPAA